MPMGHTSWGAAQGRVACFTLPKNAFMLSAPRCMPSRYDPNTPVYAGIMPYGGAGFVLSRKFLQILRFRVSAVHYNWRIVLGSAAGSDAPRVEWFPHAEVAKAQTNISGPVYPTFIEKCVNEMFGGNMCFFNSDWVSTWQALPSMGDDVTR